MVRQPAVLARPRSLGLGRPIGSRRAQPEAPQAHLDRPGADGRRRRRRLGIGRISRRRSARRRQPHARSGCRGRDRQGARRRVRRRRGAAGRRRDRRARSQALGARSGLVRRLRRQEMSDGCDRSERSSSSERFGDRLELFSVPALSLRSDLRTSSSPHDLHHRRRRRPRSASPSCRCRSRRAASASGATGRGAVGLVARLELVLHAGQVACWPPVCAGSLARRRARSSADASRYTFTSASGNTTVPMSRPSMTTPPLCTERALTRDERVADARQPRDRGRGLVDLRRANRARHVVAVDDDAAVVAVERGSSRESATGASSSSAARRARPSMRRRDTSRRCRRGVPQRGGHRARERAFARAGRPVDGDDQAAHRTRECDPSRHEDEASPRRLGASLSP